MEVTSTDDARREAILDIATFEQRTPNSITSRTEFVKRLAAVRSRGWAEDNGEFDIVSNCIAAPVWDHADRVAGAISVTTFREKTPLDELQKCVPDLLATTMSISLELGWKPTGETANSWTKAAG